MMNRQKKIINDTKKYAFSLYISKLITLPCGIITAKLLGPLLYGTWNAVKIVLVYIPFTQLGINDGISREMPFYKGKGQPEEVELIKETAFNASLIISFIVMCALLITVYYLRHRFPPLIYTGLLIVSFLSLLRQIYSFYQWLLQADSRFDLYSKVKVIHALLAATIQVLLVYYFSIYGLFAAVLITPTIIIIYLSKYIRIPFGFFKIKLRIIKKLIRTGFPMLVNGLAHTLFFTVDRLMIIAFIDQKALGLYAIALLVCSLLEFMPTSIHQVISPHLMEQRGKMKDIMLLKKYWEVPLFLLSCIMPIFIGIVWILSPIVLRHLLPQYYPGLSALKFLLVSVYFFSMVGITSKLFLALNKQHKIIPIYAIMILISVGLNYLFILQGMNIKGVALGTAISHFLLCNSLLFYATKHFEKSNYLCIKSLLKFNYPFLYTFPILLLFDRFWIHRSDLILDNISTILQKLIIFGILSLPLIYVVIKKKEVAKILFKERKRL